MRDIVEACRRPPRFAHCRFACATGTAVFQGFRTAQCFETGRMACDAPHRRATRSWPKTLGNRLYGPLSTLLGIIPTALDIDPKAYPLASGSSKYGPSGLDHFRAQIRWIAAKPWPGRGSSGRGSRTTSWAPGANGISLWVNIKGGWY